MLLRPCACLHRIFCLQAFPGLDSTTVSWSPCGEHRRSLTPSQTQGTYIFNLLHFTYCLNGLWIINDSLCPTGATAIIPLLLLCCPYCMGRVMPIAGLVSQISLVGGVKSGDLSKAELIIEEGCRQFSTLEALGCNFMTTDVVQARKTLKMQEAWAVVITDQGYFMAILKWKTDPMQSMTVSG